VAHSVTRHVKTAAISPHDIEQGRVPGWQKIDDLPDLAVRPIVRLDYADVIPVVGGVPLG